MKKLYLNRNHKYITLTLLLVIILATILSFSTNALVHVEGELSPVVDLSIPDKYVDNASRLS